MNDPLVGRSVLGRYRVLERLAKGGMGIVYLGRAEGAGGFRRPVVIKVIAPELGYDADVTGMFLREAKVLARLQHPGIVSIVDFGSERDRHLMVLEYVASYSLSDWSRYHAQQNERAPVDQACLLILQVLEALEYVHAIQRDGRPAPVVHRDISPSNILLTDGGFTKLVDFGIAKSQDDTDGYRTTDDGSAKGKFAYMAPELFRSQPASPSTDLYACGVVLREMLLGRNDFRGPDISETIQRVMRLDLELVSRTRPDVPPQLDAFLERALARRPSERFADARTMADALRPCLSRSPDAVRVEMREDLQRLFAGPLPEALGLPTLGHLQSVWKSWEKEAPAEPSQSPTGLERPAGSPTVLERPAVPAPDPPSPRRRWLPWAAALVLFLGLAGVGAGVWWERRTPAEPAEGFVVVVESNSAEPSPAAAGQTREAADDAAVAQEAPAGARAPAARMTRDSTPRDLRRALGEQRTLLSGCFDQHGTTVDSVTIRVRVGTDGGVESASVLDGAVARTDLGRCLVDATRRLRFPARPSPVSFRIPLRPH